MIIFYVLVTCVLLAVLPYQQISGGCNYLSGSRWRMIFHVSISHGPTSGTAPLNRNAQLVNSEQNKAKTLTRSQRNTISAQNIRTVFLFLIAVEQNTRIQSLNKSRPKSTQLYFFLIQEEAWKCIGKKEFDFILGSLKWNVGWVPWFYSLQFGQLLNFN